MDRLKVRCGPRRPAPISRGARTAGGVRARWHIGAVSRLRIESSPMPGRRGPVGRRSRTRTRTLKYHRPNDRGARARAGGGGVPLAQADLCAGPHVAASMRFRVDVSCPRAARRSSWPQAGPPGERQGTGRQTRPHRAGRAARAARRLRARTTTCSRLASGQHAPLHLRHKLRVGGTHVAPSIRERRGSARATGANGRTGGRRRSSSLSYSWGPSPGYRRLWASNTVLR
jgi:hypothetical protein